MDLFTEEFQSIKMTKTDVFQALSSFTIHELNYSIDGFDINFAKVDDNSTIGVLVCKKMQPDNSLLPELIQISKVIIQGDKILIHKIMGIKCSKKIEYLKS
ncbi:MAG: hypothetical protein HeimC2_36670 [Candidatus Heimdallarchaeota archaeon LC_2]|nr:MAG: hypothetical protein HeimC2_36670 [Candidatus Heimdallarchaeota archaeon LC_2]